MTKRDHLESLARRIRRAQVTAGEEPRPENYQSARARRESAAASLAQIELAERAGALMETAAVRAVLADVAAVRGDEAAISAALTRGIHRELVGIADAMERGPAT